MTDANGLRPPYSRMEHILGKEMPDAPLGQKDVEFFTRTIIIVGVIAAAPEAAVAAGGTASYYGLHQVGGRLTLWGLEQQGFGAGLVVAGGAAAGNRAASQRQIPCNDPVDEAAIRRALAGSNMRTMQPSVSLPRVQQNVKRLRAGETPGPITVYENIIVDGNHRYVAGRVFGVEPPIRPGMLSSTQTQYSKPITEILVDVVNFFD